MIIFQAEKCLRAMITSAVLVLLAAVLMIWACGKKGPPVPPTGSIPPSVKDLAYAISHNTVMLSWTVPQPNERAKLPLSGFLVFRSRLPVLETACPDCPLKFELIGDVPLREAGPDRSAQPGLTFSETIEPGYRYSYKVHGYSVDGIRSKTSNLVEFRF